MGHKEFVSVTGAISTHVFDKAGSVKTSTPFLAQKHGAGSQFILIFSIDSKECS